MRVLDERYEFGEVSAGQQSIWEPLRSHGKKGIVLLARMGPSSGRVRYKSRDQSVTDISLCPRKVFYASPRKVVYNCPHIWKHLFAIAVECKRSR